MGMALRPERSDVVTAYVALGANLGDAAAAVRAAMESLAGLPLTQVICGSSLYRTAPLADGGDTPGPAAGGDYINAVVEVQTALSAPELLRQLQALEQAAGRERPYRNAPRTLDLDLLLYGSGRMTSAQLVLPHPRMDQRAFVLVPLAEIAPALVPQAQLDAVADQAIQRLAA
ncbi:MAG: 2-amino-4-hydroxy-6-hydroxymethyldihydropteridine diphosphokinase [Polaromonas sp.]|uniref:2-amino-4-hydroxy-6- hydroxymethyldihydropteridine diphosphokinase n=1 Tax=Polaromonas sp. TaxID=1869339 RepID=UPI0027164292|nr:2-amino-4-hydroxy-6-hydroxymethyldihydropteridine diphosphokinase [Polaromonas sp.]MDO9112191.1 2-amino-4-hydroxy-6-hydroxymethyldihydropteridine diphosphokinase [Polaromonas sp.]MDP1887985.1 2-amino-4-hydroxy-6-hydroxymethyldihydropteridine diphosphokinase [Polaromonas sp.]